MIQQLFILEPIEKPLAAILEWLHASLGLSWAWSIVALTVIVRTILLPLTVRQIHSMQRLQRHAPEMKALQQRYKGDKQKQQEELMKFYKENKINPAASCLPIVFQIPVFLSLFFVLKGFEKDIFPKYPGSDLGWLGIVHDITEPLSSDKFSAVVLLILYAGSQTTSTLFMSTTMEKTQRYLLLAMPLVFLFFVVNFPAGLMIYWVTTNLWTTGQGLVTRQLRPAPAPVQKRSSRTPARGEDGGAQPKGETPKPAAKGQAARRVKRKKRARR
ncbi:MAG TPA: YidC/Oxa1 family membrane protein insertase [Gaiellaceae bacterium]|nr:YidC/Oxa1 family membrane protein insertase [Gaiellaceae bacterium]